MMHIQCACGAELEVAEIYAGGQVHCHACGATVLVPADQAADDKFRFQCPHCKARVVGRKSSAGKKSQCPACEQIYIVPDPPSDSVSPLPKESRRIELSTDDLALRIGLPFAVGKLEQPPVEPPHPRYMHSPFDRPDDGQHVEPLHTMALPAGEQEETTKLDLRVDRSAPSVGPGPQRDDQQTTTFLATAPASPVSVPPVSVPSASRPPASRSQPPAPPEWARTHGSPSSVTSSSAATAAAMPQMTAPTKPASVGELQIVTGHHSGERIRLDFHRFLIGAERDCDLRPASPLLSRHHCVFKKDEYSLRIRDLGSTNGTFVNGRRIFTEAILKPGDVVRIADLTFQVHLPRPPQVIQAASDSSPSISDFVIL
jgi:pSer/pThr/pTyr-binding forkhead associated (FHA) protein